jgi:hypothetical protein
MFLVDVSSHTMNVVSFACNRVKIQRVSCRANIPGTEWKKTLKLE